MRPTRSPLRAVTPGRRTAVASVAVALLGASACFSGDNGSPAASSTLTTAAKVAIRAAAPIRVQPSEGHPLATIDRDAGVTAQLRDGSVLWIFGDTAARRDDGTVQYFEIGTASWAAAATRTTTEDHVDPSTSAPVPFWRPEGADAVCPSPRQRAGAWPAAAITQAVGERDRVLVWLHRVCVGVDGTLADGGMALAEWWYDPATPPTTEAITLTMVQPHLFTDRSYGTAAVLAPDGNVYTYRCDAPDDPTDAAAFGPCGVARVPLDRVADGSAYEIFDNDMAMPAGATPPYPPGGFGVSYDPVIERYVMAYSPWPGPTQFVDVRTSAGPTGPWSRPVTVELQGCADHIGTRQLNCYAGAPQPAFSVDGQVGLGYYDSSISIFPTRGSYMVTSVDADNLAR